MNFDSRSTCLAHTVLLMPFGSFPAHSFFVSHTAITANLTFSSIMVLSSPSSATTSTATTLVAAAVIALTVSTRAISQKWFSLDDEALNENIEKDDSEATSCTDSESESNLIEQEDYSVLPCIRNRISRFPRTYTKTPEPLEDAVIQSLLDAALWGPFHGKCYAGCQHPAKFVVLGKQSMVEMQTMTLDFYDRNWKTAGWGSGKRGSAVEYQTWRQMTHGEITGRWGPCSHMIGIVMRRQSGSKRLPEWEEAAAVAAATQNMHIQSTKFPQLACYWSSWHDAVRDSTEMKRFLNMKEEDKCLGFFIVAQVNPHNRNKDRRARDRSLLEVEWRSWDGFLRVEFTWLVSSYCNGYTTISIFFHMHGPTNRASYPTPSTWVVRSVATPSTF